jgi:hypothetical protein
LPRRPRIGDGFLDPPPRRKGVSHQPVSNLHRSQQFNPW